MVWPLRGRNPKKWYLQSFLLDVPEICIGYWDGNHVLQRVETKPLAAIYYARIHEKQKVLEGEFHAVYRVLKSLRELCAGQALSGTSESQIWMATVHHATAPCHRTRVIGYLRLYITFGEITYHLKRVQKKLKR